MRQRPTFMATFNLTHQSDCRGLLLAQQALREDGPLPFATIAPELRVGAFLQPLPPTHEGTVRLARAMMSLAAEVSLALLDGPPVLETAFGRIPVLMIDRCKLLGQLARLAPDAEGGKARQRLKAGEVLNDLLKPVEILWEERRAAVWMALREAEWAAADRLSVYLAANRRTARMERERYLYTNAPHPTPRATDPDFVGLRDAVSKVAAARRSADLDAIKTEQSVVEAVSVALTVVAVAGALDRRWFALDPQAWKEIAEATQMADRARLHTAQAVARYLQVLRREANTYPVLLVLDHRRLVHAKMGPFARALDEALTAAEKAITSLRGSAVNAETIPDMRRPQDVTMTGLAERVAGAGKVSVWKLPFFIEQAILGLPAQDANHVLQIMELAAELEEGNAIKNNLKLFGVEAAMMVAPLTGFVGVALALAWALASLGRTVYEYQQMSDLFEASLEPALLLRGDEHGRASHVAILFDLLGLFVK